MKKYFILAAAALAFAACTSDELVPVEQTQQTTEPGAVTFDAYTQRATTRAGVNGVIKTVAANSRGLQDLGFGVFGFYTDANEYDGQTLPNFFYNEKLTYNDPISSIWNYSPVKYWPNEYGTSAIADEADKVSYFAYAPYVLVTPSTGKVNGDTSYGIVALSRNSKTGDPYTKVIASLDWSKNVDVLWGVVPSTSTTWNTVAGKEQTLAAGLPWLDVERPLEAKTQSTAEQRVKFQFEHALSQLNVVVDYDADATTHSDTENTLDATTRVYIRSVTFTGFATKGALNLNNVEPNTPLWMAFDGENDLEPGDETTLNDGRKDGREGNAAAPSEKNVYLNPSLIQANAWASDNKGVSNKPQNLFFFPAAEDVAADMIKSTPEGKVDLTAEEAIGLGIGTAAASSQDYTTGDLNTAMLNWPVMVIPNGDEMTVTITYDVETVDSKLASKLSDAQTLGSSIENKITKTITFQGAKNYMEAGKKYTVKLHLGLNSVKFDAAVSDWDTPVIEGENWLPYNETAYQAPGNYNYTIAASTTGNATFKLTGFAQGESVSGVYAAPVTGLTGTPWTAGTGATAGIVTVAANAATITANTSVVNVTTADAIKFTGATSGKQVVLNLVQLAAQPDETNSTLAITKSTSTGTFVLKAGSTALTGAVWKGSNRNVTIVNAYRNGVAMSELAESATPATATEFKCSDNGQITLGTNAAVGEVFVFTIKAGDTAPITLTCTVAD